MGLVISRVMDCLLGKKEMRILMLGLDAVGKTTILYRLKLGEIISTISTIGFNVEMVEYKNIKFTVWDMGTQDKMKLLWKHYYKDTQGLVFVVDSSDKERIELAREEIYRILGEEELKGKPLLVFANKQDIGVLSVTEVAEKLELHSLKDRDWYIQGTSAVNGEGLYEGLDWLSNSLFKQR